MNLRQLAEDLVGVCEDYNLEYDPNVLPVKLTADCYIIYATHINEKCKYHGQCKVDQYYALTGGETIKIVENDDQIRPSQKI